MFKKKGLVIIGDGGHSLAVADVIDSSENYYVVGYVSKQNDPLTTLSNYKYLGTDGDLLELRKKYKLAILGIGSSLHPRDRRTIFANLISIGFQIPSVVARNAYVSKSARIGIGTVVLHSAVVNAKARIGSNCIVNSMSLVEHEVEIGDDSVISTGVVINGGMKIGKGIFVGSRAVIRENITIGENCIIGMGSVVLGNVESGTTVIQKVVQQ